MDREELLLATDRFRVMRLSQLRPGGAVRVRDVVRHPGAVTIVPVLDNNHVCLIRNYRAAVGRELIELPAGTLDRVETPRVCAERELREETGYIAGKLAQVHEFFLSPGILDERMYLFVAEDLQPGPPEREAGEEIENWIVSWKDALGMIADRSICDAKTIVGLLFYSALRTGLR
jgi:ADP-ribose pyrophosphatase